MTKQIAFFIFLAVMLGAFAFTSYRLYHYFKLTKKSFRIDHIGERLKILLLVAFGQSKILRKPVVGLMHALVYWGFLVITIGTAEMVFDGILGTERCFQPVIGSFLYNVIIASGELFAAIIIIMIILFLGRRHILHVKRFSGVEMTRKAEGDATLALIIIGLLMVSLLGMNMGYVKIASAHPEHFRGFYPVSALLMPLIGNLEGHSLKLFHEFNWWAHIGLVFLFLNILPYSKHFHVIMSMPNVFLTRMEPYTKMINMPAVTAEVKSMMDPDAAFAEPAGDGVEMPRFGVKDVEDITWKNYIDSLTCTQCGRCTSVCPANTTGKLLSPRKIMVDTRRRMSVKGPGLIKDNSYDDGKSLVHDYITDEELWACTSCNACVQECPVNIDHVSLIMDLRRYLVMEESSAPAPLINMFSNIENNGAPWQFSPEDRMLWADNIEANVN
jgi:heterodisulfide reductase subunit C